MFEKQQDRKLKDFLPYFVVKINLNSRRHSKCFHHSNFGLIPDSKCCTVSSEKGTRGNGVLPYKQTTVKLLRETLQLKFLNNKLSTVG